MRLRIGSLLNHSLTPDLQWIEVASTLQVPSFQIVGLPAPEISEAKERVRSAIEASGFEFPRRRLVLNLAPASVRKCGTGVDLAMALAILSHDREEMLELSGAASAELGLDGRLRASGQVTRLLHAALRSQVDFVMVTAQELAAAHESLQLIYEAEPARSRKQMVVLAASDLKEAWELLNGLLKGADPGTPPKVPSVRAPTSEKSDPLPDLCLLGPSLERVICAATAGEHHLLLLGPRGTGKSQALEWLTHLLPKPSAEMRLKQKLAAELSGAADAGPIRRVGTHARPAALLGTSNSRGITPGEFSRAHGGLLIADEFPEWSRDSRETLREPLERGSVTLTRAHGSEEMPARFLFAANGNLCPCGGWPPELPMPAAKSGKLGFRPKRCRCRDAVRLGYLSRLSGPVLDRIDLVTGVCSPPEPASRNPTDHVRRVRERIQLSRATLQSTWGALPGTLSGNRLEELLQEHPNWLQSLANSKISSLRSRHKLLRVALTLGALDGSPEPDPHHFWEAEQYRPENSGWDL